MEWLTKATKWCATHNLMWIPVFGAFAYAMHSGWLAPEWTFATTKDVSAVQGMVLSINRRYDLIEPQLREIQITVLQNRLDSMRRERDELHAQRGVMTPGLDDQINEMERRLTELSKWSN